MNVLQASAFTLLTLGALSCSDAKLRSQVESGKTSATADSQTEYSNTPASSGGNVVSEPESESSLGANPGAESPESTTVELPAEPAITPIVISGASLTCSLTSAFSARCLANSPQGERLDFSVANAYIIKGSPAKWTAANFVKRAVGDWTIDVTGVTGSFGIAVQDASHATLADWIIRATDAPLNLVNDGGFETLIHLGKPDNPYQYIEAIPSNSWQARFVKDFSSCNVVYLEIQLAHDDVKPTEGKRLAELNSACRDNPAMDGPSPIAMYQTVGKLLKDNLYQIRMSYRRRADFSPAVGFQITLGNEVLPAVTVTQTAWQEYRTIVKAESLEAVLSIEETTRHSLGIGTLIDNVRIYDLGTGKE